MKTLAKSQESATNREMCALNADQQLKYLHLQAEVEVLLQQLQTLKVRRQLESTLQK